MLLLTLANTISFTSISPVDSFVYSQLFSFTVADWWRTTFGAPDETEVRARPYVLNVRVDNIDYVEVSDYATCLATERSWYLSATAFFIHMDHDIFPGSVIMQYGNGIGFSDNGVAYGDDIEYLPLITQAPGISRSEDVQGYQKLRLVSGGVTLSNRGGRLDYVVESSIIGNEARLGYIDNELVVDGNFDPDDVIPQQAYFAEEAEYGQDDLTLSLQDSRKLDVVVPTRTFDTTTYPDLADNAVGKLVPLVYGACRSVPCQPVDSNTAGTLVATYRCAELLTSITQVRVKIGDTWTVVATSSQNLAAGTFTIAVGRAGTGQAPYDCQADVVGIAVTNAPDIIVDLYARFANQAFNATFFDTATWNANKASVPTCGLVIDSARTILDIIPDIQNGVYPSFRFDTVVGGTQKTITLDDKTRPVDWFVSSLDILDGNELKPKDISEFLFGSVTVQYSKEYTENESKRVTVNTYESAVKENYQWSNSTTIPTLLTNLTDATAMANAKALEFSVPIRTMPVTLMGSRYYGVKLYDIMQIDTAFGRDEYLTSDFEGREFLGVIVCQVIGLTPNYAERTCSFTLKILDRAPEAVA
jgi:hypothetical protein